MNATLRLLTSFLKLALALPILAAWVVAFLIWLLLVITSRLTSRIHSICIELGRAATKPRSK
jgi:hypothetical protein